MTRPNNVYMHTATTIHKEEHTILFIRVTDPTDQTTVKVMSMMDALWMNVFGTLAAICETKIHISL